MSSEQLFWKEIFPSETAASSFRPPANADKDLIQLNESLQFHRNEIASSSRHQSVPSTVRMRTSFHDEITGYTQLTV